VYGSARQKHQLVAGILPILRDQKKDVNKRRASRHYLGNSWGRPFTGESRRFGRRRAVVGEFAVP